MGHRYTYSVKHNRHAVPAGVSLMHYFDILRAQWMPIVAASTASTLVVLWITGLVHQYLRKRISRHVTITKQ